MEKLKQNDKYCLLDKDRHRKGRLTFDTAGVRRAKQYLFRLTGSSSSSFFFPAKHTGKEKMTKDAEGKGGELENGIGVSGVGDGEA